MRNNTCLDGLNFIKSFGEWVEWQEAVSKTLTKLDKVDSLVNFAIERSTQQPSRERHTFWLIVWRR